MSHCFNIFCYLTEGAWWFFVVRYFAENVLQSKYQNVLVRDPPPRIMSNTPIVWHTLPNHHLVCINYLANSLMTPQRSTATTLPKIWCRRRTWWTTWLFTISENYIAAWWAAGTDSVFNQAFKPEQFHSSFKYVADS